MTGMNLKYRKQINLIREKLGIEKIISIRFSNIKPNQYIKFRDTACTALSRCFKNNILTYIDRKTGQLCPGGDYFLKISHISPEKVNDVYVKNEKVFQNNNVCNKFIKNLPNYPDIAKTRYILLTPLAKEKNKPDVIMMLASPSQTSRILGLSVYKKFLRPLILPALSTCASIYAPINSNRVHLNFIDYYDRYYQGKQKDGLLWKDSDLIISMPFGIFKEIIKYIPLSAHGGFRPKIKPQRFDPIKL
ncbi:MAG: hypothetical protein UY44_C0004G0004 [Candidatus Kaiserbacteria bacterium GW2011_GWA2_49_19]|uniref:Uncharacterized protein n=1 Tax=Candidatus Kaiserbacteria bacterium GW2011_GWA2_49_19 TaxID=1618669 RepID=A0A0G1YSD5_9BACT|nr:MAG: hypothetical protein UY44_C0004G0004 [Candidatus Kaiserbacteria bacterium GW2011_GWA2_49_19]